GCVAKRPLSFSGHIGRTRNRGRRRCLLRELDVVRQPQLAGEAITFVDPGSQALLLFPVWLGQVFTPLDDERCAVATFTHSATVKKIRIGELPNARPHDEIGVLLNLAVKGLTVSVKNDGRHPQLPIRRRLTPAVARARHWGSCSRPGRVRTGGSPSRRRHDTARWCSAAASGRRSRRSSRSA